MSEHVAGQRFGSLVAVKPRADRPGVWIFRCDCGEKVERKWHDVLGSIHDGYIPACRRCNAESKRQFNLVDYTGQRFGKLVAVRRTAHFRSSFFMWLFRCDCGRVVERIPVDVAAVVKRGGVPCCPECRPPSRKGDNAEVVVHRLWKQYRVGAHARKLEFALTEEEVRQLVTGDCEYCGTPPSRQIQRGPKSASLLVNGIDRKHNAQGYTRDNVVSCCWRCNRSKRDMSYEDWMDWIRQLAKHYEKEPTVQR